MNTKSENYSNIRTNNYQLRLMCEQDIASIRRLFFRVYGNTRQIEGDLWRYSKTELGITPVIVAEKNGEVIGSYAVWPTRILCDGSIIHGAQALDIMVDPLYNGKGLFTLMGEEIFRELKDNYNIKMLYGFPNEPSYVGHLRKMSWNHVCDIPRYIRFIHPLNKFGKLPAFIRRTVNFLADILKPFNGGGKFQIVAEQPGTGIIEKILGEIEFPKYNCQIYRDDKWFGWRYDQSSGLNHEWLSAKKDNEIKGFAVFREDYLNGFKDQKFIRISELWGDTNSIDALIRHIVRLAYERDCVLVMILTNMQHVNKALKRHLFFKLDKKPFIVRPLSSVSFPANIHVAKNWHIMSGDFDAM